MGILPADLARRVASCAGLRNRIAHDYEAIDPVLVHAGMRAAATDIPEYLRHIESHLALPGDPP